MPVLFEKPDLFNQQSDLEDAIYNEETKAMNHYERKQEARRERLEAAAERAQERANAAYKRADMSEAATGIPFGQPILVGHHSERRHRRAIERADNAMRKSVEESKRAGELAAKAAGVGTGGISSDDPDAIDKLREKLAELEKSQADNIRWNKQYRKGGIAAMDAPESVKKAIAHTMALCPYLRQPFDTTNGGANIRRVKERIAHLEAAATRENKEVSRPNGVRLVQNVDENRLQIIFPDKPDADTRAKLKSYGFRWSPMAGAWQRHLSNAAIWAADQVLKD